MYIKTEDNIIINLVHYKRLEIQQHRGRNVFELQAIYNVGSIDDKIIIATFDSRDTAEKVMNHLFEEIKETQTVWDVATVSRSTS